MRLNDQAAYLLHRRAHGERSLLVDLLTLEHGRLAAVARQVRGGSGERLATLAPFNALRVDLSGRGEVLTLTRWEAADKPIILRGPSTLAGLYVNELLVRLLARSDAHPGLFHAYDRLLGSLAEQNRSDWQLRLFEKTLLEELGYGLDFSSTADGLAIQPEAFYRVDLEQGVRASHADQGTSGAALLALGNPTNLAPSPALCNEQRILMRALLSTLLGGRPLSAWTWADSLRETARRRVQRD